MPSMNQGLFESGEKRSITKQSSNSFWLILKKWTLEQKLKFKLFQRQNKSPETKEAKKKSNNKSYKPIKFDQAGDSTS